MPCLYNKIIKEKTIMKFFEMVMLALNTDITNGKHLFGSLISDGSLLVIGVITVIAVLAAVVIILRKKKKDNKNDNNNE